MRESAPRSTQNPSEQEPQKSTQLNTSLPPGPEVAWDYIVVLKEDEAAEKENRSRREILDGGLARAREFAPKLEDLLEKRGVHTVIRPAAFSLLMLKCTPEVAMFIESLPEVEAVTPSFDVGLTP